MKRMRLTWAVLLTVTLLLAGCAKNQSRDEGARALDPVQQAIAQANAAIEAVRAAAQKGDVKTAQAAYEQFSQAFGQVLGPVSFAEPQVAQQMANANSAIKAMMTRGKLDAKVVEREVATIKLGLSDSATMMARTQARGGQAAPATAPGGAAEQAHSGHGAQEQKITVTAVDFRFQPAEIRVKKGARVTIRFENKGTERHEFELADFDFEIGPIEPGKAVEGSFVAAKKGLLPYECHLDDHRQKGMKGILVVED